MANSRTVMFMDSIESLGTLKEQLGENLNQQPFMVRMCSFLKGMMAGNRHATMRHGSVNLTSSSAFAAKVGTFTGLPAASTTCAIGGVTITAVTSATPANNEFVIAASSSGTATNMAAAINDSTTTALSGVVIASVSGSAVTVTCLIPGALGNVVVLADSLANFTWAGGDTALSGGVGGYPSLKVKTY